MDRIGVMLLLLAFCTFACTCCVGSFSQHTYSFTITATSGGVTHTVPMTLTIQALK